MLDNHRYDLRIIAINKTEAVEYKSRYDASVKIAKARGIKPTTADKEIRKAIYQKIVRYGYNWQYIK